MGIDLSGKVVIVTGGAKGIGEGCVQKFLDSNAIVISFDLDDSSLVIQESKYSNLDYVFNTACSGVIQKNENSITINQGIIESELRINNMDFVMKSIFDPIVLDYLKS